MSNDPRLVNRQLFLLEQTKVILNMLEGTEEIDWELIAKIGKEISATAQTAMSLDIPKRHSK